ncbi:hypothetical protein UYSO10_2488 [Kosakonia radicincitans]|uniref:RES family NAD+ phosphorylase n=1 Tax=Kosakonia radicincitans TaxID=283686 RepID=UPI0011844B5D|nr:RES family NAD+ phosphorylase [Kosakonia radicincitans]VVT48756.1 hypothetical protein UYSO10_2488 [Kosakonia radicincitans]
MSDIDPDETWICADCIREPFLNACIEADGVNHTCHYCGGNTQACFSVSAISERVEQAIAEHYVRTLEHPSELEYAMQRHSEGEYEWEREGSGIVYVIEDLLGTSEAVAGDVQHYLMEKHYDFEAAKMHEECEFDLDSRYEERGKVESGDFDIMWSRLVNSLKTESRYTNHTVRETLDGIFCDVESLRSRGNKTVITRAGPGGEVPFLYRARWCRDHNELEAMLVTPDKELGPPPSRFSGSNRMSAKGISVFYGASSVETAISEIRPPVGCNVVTSKFNITRPLRLLNLPALESLLERGSKFDPDYINRRQQAAFLRTLTSRIVEPVMPGEEDFSYIPTQVVAEYLADPDLFDLDGILYPSVQLSGSGDDNNYNVVLFHKSSRTHYLKLPDRKDCRIQFERQCGEDEWEPDICVTQTAESGDDTPRPEIPQVPPHLRDVRVPALEIDLLSVCIHGIQAVRFEYSTDPVTRDKCIYSFPAVSPFVVEDAPWSTGAGQEDNPF